MQAARLTSKIEKQRLAKVLEQYGFNLNKIKVLKNTVANVNNVFVIVDGKNKYVLRESQPKKVLKHLRLEIAVLEYLKNKRFKLTAHVIPNVGGHKITRLKGRFYTLQNFMPGETKVSWNNLKKFNDKRVLSFFAALASFSKAVKGFRIKSKSSIKPLWYYAKNGPELLDDLLRQLPQSKAKKLLKENKTFILEFINQSNGELEKAGYKKLPQQIVHFDFHPGNVNFSGDRVSGIFDFDWVRFDSRISDIAGAIGQSCYRYHGPKAAIYDRRRIKLGLESYRKTYGKSEFSPEKENCLIKIALKAYMFYQLLWSIDSYINHPEDPKGYEYVDFMLKTLKLNDYDKLFA